LQGPTGVQGNTGIQGLTGVQGNTGLQGPTGVQGTQGNTGVQGNTGLQGPTGVQGQTGLKGVTGVQGNTGLQGPTGVQGQTGLKGVTGVQGNQGATGAQAVGGITGTLTSGDVVVATGTNTVGVSTILMSGSTFENSVNIGGSCEVLAYNPHDDGWASIKASTAGDKIFDMLSCGVNYDTDYGHISGVNSSLLNDLWSSGSALMLEQQGNNPMYLVTQGNTRVGITGDGAVYVPICLTVGFPGTYATTGNLMVKDRVTCGGHLRVGDSTADNASYTFSVNFPSEDTQWADATAIHATSSTISGASGWIKLWVNHPTDGYVQRYIPMFNTVTT
jgi:hypothetical protein